MKIIFHLTTKEQKCVQKSTGKVTKEVMLFYLKPALSNIYEMFVLSSKANIVFFLNTKNVMCITLKQRAEEQSELF